MPGKKKKRKLGEPSIQWLIFKISFPFLVIVIMAILFAISAIPVFGWILSLTYILLPMVQIIYMYTAFYRMGQRNISITSGYNWLCYIFYSLFIPGGGIIVSYELR